MTNKINDFTEKCRVLQEMFRKEINEEMGVGPLKTSETKQKNMIVDGEKTGKNFVDQFTFMYAKQRVEGKKRNETIDEYRLFNNLLSSQPMAFNLFCPLIEMLKDGETELVTRLVSSAFPAFAIGQVTEIELEYLHTDVENYLNDRTAMDAIIRYRDTDDRPCFIAIETKYTDVLGANSARNTEKQKELIRQLGFFQPSSEEALLDGRKSISQIYRNFLLSECYRIKEGAYECHSVILSPKDHPTTEEEVNSLKGELQPRYQYKVQAVSLEDFVEHILQACPSEKASAFLWFKERYLNFEKLRR